MDLRGTEEWRILHNVELTNLYTSPNIVRVIKSTRMGWAGHVARKGERRGVYRVLVWKREGRNNLVDPGVDGRIILRCIFGSGISGHGLDRCGSG